MKKVDVIIPCYNEAERIGKILKPLTNSPYIKKVIVVDDGSTDNSVEVAKRFPKTKIVQLPENIGKGGAVKAGLEEVDTDTVFVSDADLKGFKEHHIKALIEEYYKKHVPVIGIPRTSDNKVWYWVRENLLARVDGQRVLKTKDLEKVLDSESSQRFGLEAWMNYYFKRKKMTPTLIPLPGVRNGPFLGRKGIIRMALEVSEMGETYFEIYKDSLVKALQLP